MGGRESQLISASPGPVWSTRLRWRGGGGHGMLASRGEFRGRGKSVFVWDSLVAGNLRAIMVWIFPKVLSYLCLFKPGCNPIFKIGETKCKSLWITVEKHIIWPLFRIFGWMFPPQCLWRLWPWFKSVIKYVLVVSSNNISIRSKQV